MERGQLIETYRILQKCKLNGLKQNTKFALLHDMSGFTYEETNELKPTEEQ